MTSSPQRRSGKPVRGNWQQVRTKYGRAPGISKGGSLYVNANEAAALFGLKGTLEDNGTYVIQ